MIYTYFCSRSLNYYILVQPMIEAINGDITNQQRKRIESLRWKFWMIVIIFYIW